MGGRGVCPKMESRESQNKKEDLEMINETDVKALLESL